MIKNEKIKKLLCKHFLPEGETKVKVVDVIGISFLAVLYYGFLAAFMLLWVYIAGDIVGDLASTVMTAHTVTTYTYAERFMYGLGTISGLICAVYLIYRLCIIELVECPLQMGEDGAEETE